MHTRAREQGGETQPRGSNAAVRIGANYADARASPTRVRHATHGGCGKVLLARGGWASAARVARRERSKCRPGTRVMRMNRHPGLPVMSTGAREERTTRRTRFAWGARTFLMNATRAMRVQWSAGARCEECRNVYKTCTASSMLHLHARMCGTKLRIYALAGSGGGEERVLGWNGQRMIAAPKAEHSGNAVGAEAEAEAGGGRREAGGGRREAPTRFRFQRRKSDARRKWHARVDNGVKSGAGGDNKRTHRGEKRRKWMPARRPTCIESLSNGRSTWLAEQYNARVRETHCCPGHGRRDMPKLGESWVNFG
ncbi:hypothetical protein C8R44DRAFT_730333 [Mycena epipterygia]|nr:hypothetical protein C8R44DRAFT_730333 [Mycena epipterygia]